MYRGGGIGFSLIGRVSFLLALVMIVLSGASAAASAAAPNLVAWGYNFGGQLGDHMETDSGAPVPVLAGAIPSGVSITQIAGGGYHSLALGSNGHVYAWGQNLNGQLGNGSASPTDSTAPVAVSAGEIPAGVRITQISAGAYYSLALGSNGKVYGWGNDAAGQLGNGTTMPTSVPAPVAMSAGAIPSGVSITQISAGQDHSLMLGSDGHVYASGNNANGKLGNGSTTPSSSPVEVAAGAIPVGVSITKISAGFFHSLALGGDGHVYAWGYNVNGQLGDGFMTDAHTPVAVSVGAIPAGVSATQIFAGGHHSLALGSNGHVYAWGRNADGELGNGSVTNADSDVPVAVVAGAIPAGVSITRISAGFVHSLALGSNGHVYTWGKNDDGQLGNGTRGTTPSSNSPVAVSQPSGSVIRMAVSGSSANHILALVATAVAMHRLTVTRTGSGSGTVSSAPAGINCGATCSAQFRDGASVKLIPAAAGGSRFAGWSGGGCSGTGNCTVTMRTDSAVTARFAAPPNTRMDRAKISQKKRSATFKFMSAGAGTRFQCALQRKRKSRKLAKHPRFMKCKSPKTYKHLKPGKYVFEVRALGVGGPDPTPAKKTFTLG